MKTYNYSALSPEENRELLKRPKIDFTSIFGTVQPILDAVETDGDEAVKKFTQKFDGVNLDSVVINPKEVEVSLDEETKKAIDLAFDNIFRFHKAQFQEPIEVETMPGVRCMKVARPIERVGLYVPGGTAILPSSAMMLSIPALIAGCTTKVLATPPQKDGTVAPEIIYIAKKAEVDQVLLAGGAQAVAAMAFGTQTVSKVDKIFGPGNQYVTAAKMILQNSEAQISIDMPAGPSEVLVVADAQANPAYVAADLLSQAEHGKDSQVVLVATSDFDLDALNKELEDQLNQLPRKEIAKQSLSHSYSIVVDSVEEAFSFSNQYAPEHLIVNVKDAEFHTEKIINAGSVFLGQLTPESVGDYASGTNHTLPTYGYARMYSGVNLAAYQKSVTMQSLTEEGLKNIGPAVEKLAELEELQAHKNAVSLRLKNIEHSTSNKEH
ncbi:histidinol dehydrogenase [Gracilimonas tropica]|uniref:histidinol dehydrogenase n=1 Tax=Gracilimonas tropica TaxID=454600 RepID=UPI0003741BB6|nr:histidinol dehydrogenase [Gracilimonas tropica]